VLDSAAEAEIIRRIDAAKKAGDTLGGEVEVVARGVVVGLGSHVSWDRKLDGRLAGMLMSIPAVKGVEIGMGFEAARRPGSEVHDPIVGGEAGRVGSGEAGKRGSGKEDVRGGFRRPTNNAGGLEGGITTGEPVVVKVAMKPIATLMSPLPTVDLASGEPAKAVSERSDITAVPAMGVIAEALVGLVLAEAGESDLRHGGRGPVPGDGARRRECGSGRGTRRDRPGRRLGRSAGATRGRQGVEPCRLPQLPAWHRGQAQSGG